MLFFILNGICFLLVSGLKFVFSKIWFFDILIVFGGNFLIIICFYGSVILFVMCVSWGCMVKVKLGIILIFIIGGSLIIIEGVCICVLSC